MVDAIRARPRVARYEGPYPHRRHGKTGETLLRELTIGAGPAPGSPAVPRSRLCPGIGEQRQEQGLIDRLKHERSHRVIGGSSQIHNDPTETGKLSRFLSVSSLRKLLCKTQGQIVCLLDVILIPCGPG